MVDSGGLAPKGSLREKPLRCKAALVKYYTYILKSSAAGTYYYGSTSDLASRLKNHNAGKVRSTKAKRPWIIHYSEEFQDKSSAIRRELFFKSIAGYLFLREQGIIS